MSKGTPWKEVRDKTLSSEARERVKERAQKELETVNREERCPRIGGPVYMRDDKPCPECGAVDTHQPKQRLRERIADLEAKLAAEVKRREEAEQCTRCDGLRGYDRYHVNGRPREECRECIGSGVVDINTSLESMCAACLGSGRDRGPREG